MGAVCCGNESRDIASFWRGLELRKISFERFCQIYEKNQMNWLNSGENNRVVDLRKCQELNTLLVSQDFSAEEKLIFLDKLNEFINSQSDKLTFFTSLSFFTKLNEDGEISKNSKSKKNEKLSYIESLRANERTKNFDIVFDSLLKMAIKKKDHEDVTKLFLQLVTEFPVPFLHAGKKDRDEKLGLYCRENRDRLFAQLKMFNSQKFYEFMFNLENVSLVHNELVKIHAMNPLNNGVEQLVKVRTTANAAAAAAAAGGATPTPGNVTAVKAK